VESCMRKKLYSQYRRKFGSRFHGV